jgi:hypothetical protein
MVIRSPSREFDKEAREQEFEKASLAEALESTIADYRAEAERRA